MAIRWITSQLRVNQTFQLKIVAFCIFILVCYAMVTFLGIHFFIHKFTLLGDDIGLSHHELFYKFIDRQQSKLMLIHGVSFFILVLGLVLGLMWMSNKVAGPIMRLDRHLRKLSKDGEDLEKLYFRPKDELKNIEESFNTFIDRCQKDVQ